jgi:hypothetical protein
MSGFDLEPFYNERRGKWIIRNGGETFYNEKNEMREWDTKKDALLWLFNEWAKVTPGADRYGVVERGQMRMPI